MGQGIDTPGYSITRRDDVLVLATGSFEAERGSVLHSGIYNREFASALTSFGLAGLVYLVLGLRYGKTLLTHAVVFVVFVAGFLLLRSLVFRDRLLEAEFDRRTREVRLSRTSGPRRRTEVIPMGRVERLRIDKREIGVENPDAVAFVEKISAQHGTVIPGFGEEAVFYSLQLVLTDGSIRTLYAGRGPEEALRVHEAVSGFLDMDLIARN